MKVNKATIDLVKKFEGLKLKAYICPAGVLTIGYGYTNKAGFGPGVKAGDVWTEEMADQMLHEGLKVFADEIRPLFKRRATPNQFGAFLSLAYNIGTGAFSRSTALRRFNAGDDAGAVEALTWFNKAGGRVMRGLVRRREAEKALFLTDSAADLDEGSGSKADDVERQPAPKREIGGGNIFSKLFGGK